MSQPALSIEDLWKQYRRGVINHGVLFRDLQSWWAKTRGKPDPNARIEDNNFKEDDRVDGEASDRFWALQSISLNVGQGEVVGVIGKNGAGKSTLLKLLSRVTSPTRGEMRIKGRIASLLEVGTGFHPELTGRENIFLNATLLGMKRHEVLRRLDEIISFAGVEAFIDTPIKRYSSGMAVRLGFAVAAHLEAEILIVDEVLAVGDFEFQKKCIEKMDQIGKTGRTILFVSHNMQSIVSLCPRAVLLERGRLTMDSDAESVVTAYMSTVGRKESEVTWPDQALAPGNENVRLAAVRLIGAPNNAIAYEKEITIEMDYWNLRDGNKLYPVVQVKDSKGQLAFSTTHLPPISRRTDPYYDKPREKGLYRSVCVIPGRMLNSGDFILDAVINESPGRYGGAYALDLLRFHVVEPEDMRRHFAGKFTSAFLPTVDWETTKL